MKFRVTTVALLKITLMITACAPTAQPEATPRPVRVQRTALRSADGALRYAATLQPREQVALAFAISGYVNQLHRVRGPDGALRDVQPGDSVPRGAVLARIREADYRERLGQARAQEEEARASLTRARLDFERAERLYASHSLTRPDYDAAVASFEMARARLAAADAAREAAEIVLRDTALVAPMRALVLSRTLERGALASPGVVAFTIADVDRIEAVFGVPEEVAASLSLGEELEIEVDTRARAGEVTAIAPSADAESRVFRIEVTLDNADHRLRPGALATAIVPERAGRESKAPLAVPLGAIVSSGARGYGVFVVERTGDRSIARLRGVELGAVLSNNSVAVTSGLAASEALIVSGAAQLVDGEAVRVIP